MHVVMCSAPLALLEWLLVGTAREIMGQISLFRTGGRKINCTEASAGRTTESKSVVSGNSASPFPICPS